MKKYELKWSNGMVSALPLTKEQVMIALTNWYQEIDKCNHVTVKNLKTGKEDVYFGEWKIEKVNELSV